MKGKVVEDVTGWLEERCRLADRAAAVAAAASMAGVGGVGGVGGGDGGKGGGGGGGHGGEQDGPFEDPEMEHRP